MTDKELLELAAKAAGIDRGADRLDFGILVTEKTGRRSLPKWNPLEDDGDALRLAVTLGMNLMLLPGNLGKGFCTVGVGFNDDSGIPRVNITEDYSQGTLKAVRRAIVRATPSKGVK